MPTLGTLAFIDGTDDLVEGTWRSLVTNETLSFLPFDGAAPITSQISNCIVMGQIQGLEVVVQDTRCDLTGFESNFDAVNAFCEAKGLSYFIKSAYDSAFSLTGNLM